MNDVGVTPAAIIDYKPGHPHPCPPSQKKRKKAKKAKQASVKANESTTTEGGKQVVDTEAKQEHGRRGNAEMVASERDQVTKPRVRVRLFAYGMEKARAKVKRVLSDKGDWHPENDWFIS